MAVRTTTTEADPVVEGALARRLSSPALLLALLGHVAMRRLRDTHTAHGLTPRQFHLLEVLHEHGATGQSELGAMMGTDPSILVTMLNPLETDQLVRRERDEHDRRRHLVRLTSTGETQLIAAARAQQETEDELFAALDSEQRAQLQALLTTLQTGLAGTAGSPCAAAAADPEATLADGPFINSEDRSST